MITVTHKGDFSRTTKYFNRLSEIQNNINFGRYGDEGVRLLSSATPVDTGKTASSWSYSVIKKNGVVSISFNNSNIVDGVPIAIILQYGHGTRNGGYVEGIDYINPALRPLFDKLADDAWEEIRKV